MFTCSCRDVAVQLVECYAKIFKMQHVSPKSSSSSSSSKSKSKSKSKASPAASEDTDGGKKVLPVVLAGINRALPFASAGGSSRSTAAVEALMESLFETVEQSSGSFSAATQALLVLQQLLPGASSSTCARVYTALYVTPSIITDFVHCSHAHCTHPHRHRIIISPPPPPPPCCSYARIISPDLRHASKPAMFLNAVCVCPNIITGFVC